MDVAALQMSVDTTDVVKAVADLEKFSSSSDKAAASADKLSGGGATRLGQDYARAARAADQASGSVMRIAESAMKADAAMRAASSASSVTRAANDNVARSFTNADAQVIAYREHLRSLVAAQNAQSQSSAANASAVTAAGRASEAAAASVAKAETASRGAAAGMGLATAAGRLLSGVLGGVVGIALGVVTGAVMEFVSSLFQSKDAMDVNVIAADNLAAAQSVLGKMFDLSTGKIRNNTQALRDQIYMQQKAMENQAIAARAEASAQLSEAGLGRTTAGGRFLTRLGGIASQNPVGAEARIIAAEAQGRKLESLLTGLEQGAIGREEVGRIIDRMENITAAQRLQLQAAASRAYEAGTANQAARDMGSALNGKLPPSYITPEDGVSGRAARTAGRASRAAELSDEAKALQERARATDQFIASLEQEVAKIGLSGEALRKYEVTQALARATTDKQREAIEKLSAKREEGLKVLRQQQEVEAAQKQLAAVRSDMVNGIDIELATMGMVGAEREREILRIQRQIEMTDLLTKIQKAEADGNVALADTYRQLAEAIDEKYAKQMRAISGRETIEQMRELNSIMTRGVESLNNGLVDAIMGTKSLGDVFKQVANQIIADLIRIAIRQLIVNTLMKALGLGGGGSFLSGLFADGGAFGTAQQYARGGAFDRAQKFANGGTFTNQVITQPTLFKFANGSKLGEVGEAGPEAIMPLTRGANGKLGVQAHGGGGGKRPVEVNVTNNNSFAGAIGVDSIIAMQRQAAAQTDQHIRENLPRYLREWDMDGTASRG